jgi:hypothetical protein
MWFMPTKSSTIWPTRAMGMWSFLLAICSSGRCYAPPIAGANRSRLVAVSYWAEPFRPNRYIFSFFLFINKFWMCRYLIWMKFKLRTNFISGTKFEFGTNYEFRSYFEFWTNFKFWIISNLEQFSNFEQISNLEQFLNLEQISNWNKFWIGTNFKFEFEQNFELEQISYLHKIRKPNKFQIFTKIWNWTNFDTR